MPLYHIYNIHNFKYICIVVLFLFCISNSYILFCLLYKLPITYYYSINPQMIELQKQPTKLLLFVCFFTNK